MKKSKYKNTDNPNRAKDTEFSKFRAVMAKLEYELAQREKNKKANREQKTFVPKRHKRDDDHTEDLKGAR